MFTARRSRTAGNGYLCSPISTRTRMSFNLIQAWLDMKAQIPALPIEGIGINTLVDASPGFPAAGVAYHDTTSGNSGGTGGRITR